MNVEYRKLLLSELRCLVCQPPAEALSDERLTMAATANENLLSLGYTLKPADIVLLAQSESLECFFDETKALVGTVDAKPMYPDFPQQVMGLSEAQFRMCQIMHYFSTYGMEELFGEKVSRGWLPQVESTPKTENDTALLEAKTVELVCGESVHRLPLARILNKRERMTLPEREIVREAMTKVPVEFILEQEIAFKQNLMDIFYLIMTVYQPDEALDMLHRLCQHTGDVLKCADYALTRCGYHFKTSQKRLLVKLLESYPIVDFKANLILSLKKAERSILLLKYLDYNEYSRSAEHKAAVASLRNGELRSWESRAKYLLQNEKDNALDYIAAHPGTMLRMTAWLLRLGYPSQEIHSRLMSSADSLSTQTLVTVLTHFGALLESEEKAEEAKQVYGIMHSLLKAKLEKARTAIYGKRLYVDMPEYNLSCSTVQCNNKSPEGGYIRSGIAYNIPQNAKYVRFFIYWNDKERVDIDLHVSAMKKNGERCCVGWNADFKDSGIVFSGDITHSDAAEYMDIKMDSDVKEATANINIYWGAEGFNKIEECFVGMMAVDKIGKKIKLYDPANCFFVHRLRGAYKGMHYGYVDTENRCLVFDGAAHKMSYYEPSLHPHNEFSLESYLSLLFEAQKVTVAESREDAELVLVMGKPNDKAEISLIDENFFL